MINISGRNIKFNLSFVIFLGLVYIFFGTGNIDSSDTRIRLEVSKKIANNQEPSFGDDYINSGGIIYGRDGKRFSVFSLGQSLLGVPVYGLSRFCNKYFPKFDPDYSFYFLFSLLNPVVSAITCWLIYLIVINIGYSTRSAVTVSLIYGFCTIAFQQAQNSFEHPLETLLLAGAILLLVGTNSGSKDYKAVILGAILGLGILMRNTYIFALPGLMFYYSCRMLAEGYSGKIIIRKILLVLAVTVVVITPQLYYNNYRFVSIWSNGYGAVPRGIPIVGIADLLFSPRCGLFIFQPVLMAGLLGLIAMWRKNGKRYLAIMIAIISLCYLIGCAPFSGNTGWSWGPRLLLPCVLLLSLPLAEFMEHSTKISRLHLFLWRTVIFISLAVSLSSVVGNYRRLSMEQEIKDMGRQERFYSWEQSPIVRQFYDLPLLWRNVFTKKPHDFILVIHKENSLTKAELLEKSAWLNLPMLWFIRFYFNGLLPPVIIFFILIFMVIIAFWLITFLKKNINSRLSV